MHQCRRRQSVCAATRQEAAVCDDAQIVVGERHQLRKGVGIALAPAIEQGGDRSVIWRHARRGRRAGNSNLAKISLIRSPATRTAARRLAMAASTHGAATAWWRTPQPLSLGGHHGEEDGILDSEVPAELLGDEPTEILALFRKNPRGLQGG